MQIKRTAHARWTGTGKEGKGVLGTQSKAIWEIPYSYRTRFEDEPGTNPEELIGAAHAGCFSMKLAFNFQEAGITPESIDTHSTIVLEDGKIIEAHLQTEVKAKGLDQAKLDELANNAKVNCPISKLLNTNIIMSAKLIS